MKQRKTLVFNHIPKTAGSTFLNILQKQYFNDEIYIIDAMNFSNSIRRFKKLSETERSRIKCITGHGTSLLFEDLKDPYEVVTFVRNPNETLISSYYYIKRATWNKYHKDVVKMNSILEFIEFRKDLNLDNQQTRYLANSIDHLLLDTNPFCAVDELMYEKGLENLKLIKNVFTTEEFNFAVYKLYIELNWRKLPFYTMLNKTKNRSSINSYTDKELEAIDSCNKYDKLIYDFVLKLQISEQKGLSFRDKLRHSAFYLSNSIYSNIRK